MLLLCCTGTDNLKIWSKNDQTNSFLQLPQNNPSYRLDCRRLYFLVLAPF